MMLWLRKALLKGGVAVALLAGCGPQMGDLEQGESGRVVETFNGDTLVLDTGLRVFLAEIDAPNGEAPYAAAAQAELDALALHRDARLGYGGTQRWRPTRTRDGETPTETAIAHVFIQGEGGGWTWLQQALVLKGAVYVQPRPDNHARAETLYDGEAAARAEQLGLWGERAYQVRSPREAAREAASLAARCQDRGAPFRFVEGVVRSVDGTTSRVELQMDASAEAPFALVAFGATLNGWRGLEPQALVGRRVRARGPLEYFQRRGADFGQAQMCIWDSGAIELMSDD